MDNADNAVAEATTSGTGLNTSLITGLSSPSGIAIVTTPESSSLTLLGLGLAGVGFCARRKRAS